MGRPTGPSFVAGRGATGAPGRRVTSAAPAAFVAALFVCVPPSLEAQTVAEPLVWGPSGRHGQVSALVGRWAALGAIDTALNAPADAQTVFVTGGGTALAEAVALAGSSGTLIEIVDSATYAPVVFRNKSRVYVRARAGQTPKIVSDATAPTSAGGGNSNAVIFEGDNVDIGLQGLTFLVRHLGNAESPRRPGKVGAIRYSNGPGGLGTRLQGLLVQDCAFQPVDGTLGAVVAVQVSNAGGALASHRDIGIRRAVFDSTGTVESALDGLAAITVTDFENVLVSNVHLRRTSTQASPSEMRGLQPNVRGGLVEYAYCEDLGSAPGQANDCVALSATHGALDGLDVVARHTISLNGNRAFAIARAGSTLTVEHGVVVTNAADRILAIDHASATLTTRDSIFVQLSGATPLLTPVPGATFVADHNLYNWLGPYGFVPDATDRYPGAPTCDALCAPLLANPLGSDFRLLAGSPASGAASDGTDLGALFFARSPASHAFGPSGGSGSVFVQAPGSWSGVSQAPWITPSTFGPFVGEGSVGFLVAPNLSSAPRIGTLVLAGMAVTVTQTGIACNFAVSPLSQAASAGGGTVAVSVSTAAADCQWTAASQVPWIAVTAGGTNSGPGMSELLVAPNPSSISRTGTVLVAGVPISIVQSGQACQFALSSTGATLPAEGGAGLTLGLSAAVDDCAWSASSTASWVTLSPATGQGSATLTYSVGPNPNAALRSAQVVAGGQTFTVAQAGVSCTYALGASSAYLPASGASQRTVSMATNAPDCTWTTAASASWVTVSTAPVQTGTGSVTYSVAPNSSSQVRTTALVIGGQTFRVDQAGTACTFSLSASQTASPVDASGGVGSVGVTAAAGDCGWTAVSHAAWVTVSGGSPGTGSGPVSFAVAANPSSLPRSANLTIAGQSYTVHQAGLPCGIALAPTAQSMAESGGDGGFAVSTAVADCAWTAVSDVPWLQVATGASGTGPGSVTVTAVANPNSQPRTGTVSVGGRTFTVNQAGVACGYTLPATSGTVGPTAGSSSVAVVATAPDCTWSSTSPVAWLALTGGTARAGSTSATFSVTANPSSQPRTAVMTVAGQAYGLRQQGVTCTYSLSASSTSMVVGGGTKSVLLTTPASDCPWTTASQADWITVSSSASGQGNSTVSLVVAPNPSSRPRTGLVTIAGLTYTVSQAAAPCSYTLATKAISAPAGGGTSSLSMTTSPSDCGWTAATAAAWITPSASQGTGTATLDLTIAPTTSSKTRSGTLTVQGQTATITQSGLTCVNTLSSTAASYGHLAATGSISVTSNAADCAWTSTNGGAAWVTVTSGASGVGNRTVTYTVRANTATQPRSATLAIAGVPFGVTQAGAPCSASVSSTSVQVGALASTGKLTVTAASADCGWTATSTAPWIAIVAGGTSTGTGSVTYAWTANPGSQPRTGTLAVAGQTVTVTQAGVACVAKLSPASATLPAAGGTGTVDLSLTPGDCAFTASSNGSWLTVTSPTSGVGSRVVSFSAAPNQDTKSRTATLTVAGKSFAVTQAAMGGTANPFRRYLAEGASSDLFRTRIALLNPGATQTTATLRFQKDDGSIVTASVPVRGYGRATVHAEEVLGPGPTSFSTEIESPAALVVDRTLQWSATGRYGSHAETSVGWPSETWYLAEGSTGGHFDLFYLLQNPNDAPANVTVTFLLPGGGSPVVRHYTLAPQSRFTLWVDGVPGLASTDVSAIVRADRGIIVERAMYLTREGEPLYAAGHASAGITAPETSWFLAEGATGPYFDLYVLIANPTTDPALVHAKYLLTDGTVVERTYDVAPLSRFTIWVEQEDPLLADAAVSTIVTSTNGVPIIVERAMWWPGNWTTWTEAHNSPGATDTGTRWALAEGEVGGPQNAETYILIANTSATAGSAKVTLYFESGSPLSATVPLPANSRTNVHVASAFSQAAGRRFGAVVESLGTAPAQIVVERAMYTDAGGQRWAAGTNALATRLK